MNINEQLDFCRVKKFNEKGYGFLKSLIYQGDIFFHFSQVKSEEIKEKLDKMKRGDFFLYFISKQNEEGKRKVIKLWYSLKDVPETYSKEFINTIIIKFNDDKINVFDLLFAFNEIKQKHGLNTEQIIEIFNSKKIKHNPTTILPFLNKNEYELLKTKLEIHPLENIKPYWYDELINYKIEE
ncbi:MAG TPA: cold shock domain-containing protein [Melioribacteraceae bacterium]|nr:cold shock domain-containing protein [Melioribacteraceae bacterium]